MGVKFGAEGLVDHVERGNGKGEKGTYYSQDHFVYLGVFHSSRWLGCCIEREVQKGP